ncbi:MAG: hypothetical protein KF726_01985 [Anaerolineae bacterium]|nr:hypothetical protein [Anaerolineae bacterium]
MTSLERLHNRIDLVAVPYTDRGSRLLLFREGQYLSVRLAERWEKWQNEYGHYRQRPPIIEKFRFLDSEGNPLDFEVDTYPHVVKLSTAAGMFGWTFADVETMLVRLPAGKCGFEFQALGESGGTDRRGGTMHGKRNIAYTTAAEILSNKLTVLEADKGRIRVSVQLQAQEGDTLLLNVTPRLGFNRSLPTADALIERNRLTWETWFNAAPPVLDEYMEQYLYAWWIMRAGLLNQRYFFTREALVPSKIHYIGVWQWDQFFHALAYRHIDTNLAEDQIRIVLDHQREDGMLPDAIHDEGLVRRLNFPVEADVTKPPLIAWAALKLYDHSGHLDFLEEVYEPIIRWHDWWLRDNRNDCGLCEYRHPFSSGLDDSPLWDDGMPVVAPDLNTYLCLQSESLARIASLIGDGAAAAKFLQEANDRAKQMTDVLWDDKLGIFKSLHLNKTVDVMTPFSLLPLITGRVPEEMAKRLIARLTDPQQFWTEHKIPSVAINDPKFDGNKMWRGPMWPNINHLFVEALTRVGRVDLAGELRRSTLRTIQSHKDIYEYYNPLDGTRPPKAAPIFGWSSAVFIDLAIQETRSYTDGAGTGAVSEVNSQATS